MSETKETDSSWSSVRLALPFFKQYRLRLLVGFASLLAVDFLQLLIPRVIKRAIDSLQTGLASNSGLLKHAGLIVFLALGIALLRFGWRYLILGFSRRLERDFRDWLFSHLLTLDRIFFQRRTIGELMALSSNDLAAVQMAGGMGLVACVDAIIMTLAALAFMAYIHPTLTIIAILPMPVLAVLTRLLSARLHRRFKKVQERFSDLTEFARTTISSMRLIKAYTQERSQTERFDRMGRKYIRDNLKLAMVQGTLFPVSGLIANLSLLLVLFFGGRLTINGIITVGDFVAFITYLFMLTWPMMAIGWVSNLFQRGATSLARIQKVLDEEPTLKDPAKTERCPALTENISLKSLTFRYAGQEKPALLEINVDIKPGILGIVGRTGSGKTTFCHLLARLYPVPDKTMFIEGVDVNRLMIREVRGRIAYVPQDVLVFSGSIAFNIAMGKANASQEEIEKVARAVALHDEIMAMENAYETRVGERGVKISGGQRQRIALARALLLNRPIIIIDDGLSAVDTETEHMIIGSIAGMLQGRTCIIVSHRVAALADAEEIIVMEQGRIAARGRHDHLLANSAFYKTIYDHQTREL